MSYNRQTWQHEFESRSVSQLSDAFQSVGWVVEGIKHDYGEDLFARPFENGNPTGHEFFIQLKGTDNIEQHRLKNRKWFSYSIELVNLSQWYSYTLPVILIIWDIKDKFGFWVHVQPFIKGKLKANPEWLKNTTEAKEPRRNVRIPSKQFIKEDNLDSIKPIIEIEWKKIERGKQHFEILYQVEGADLGNEHAPDLPLAIERQLRLTELKATLTVNQHQPNQWLELASIYYDLNNLPEALKAIDNAWSLDSNSNNISQVRACILAEYAINNGNPPSILHKAISLFQSSDNSSSFLRNYNIGNCYSALKQHENAIRHYDKALESNPSPKQAARIWTNRGNSADGNGNRKDAIHSFKMAIKSNPSNWNAHASWAALEARYGNFESACHHFYNTLRYNQELETNGDNLLYWFAYSLYETEEYSRALQIVNKRLVAYPVDEDALVLKTHILYKLRRTDDNFLDEARSFFEERLLDNTTDVLIRSELNFIYLSQGDTDKRWKLLEDTVALDDPPVMALHDYAIMLEDDDNLDRALYYLEQAEKRESSHAIVHALARLYRKTGKYKEAIDFYHLALEGIANPLPILEKLTDCYHFLNDYQSCVVVISQALISGSPSESWWNNLSFALDELGADSTKFINFLSVKLYNQDALSESEIRSKLAELII